MAAPKRPTHVLKHRQYHAAVKGKSGLQHIKPGTQLVLTAAEAKKLGSRVTPLDGEQVELGSDDNSPVG